MFRGDPCRFYPYFTILIRNEQDLSLLFQDFILLWIYDDKFIFIAPNSDITTKERKKLSVSNYINFENINFVYFTTFVFYFVIFLFYPLHYSYFYFD